MKTVQTAASLQAPEVPPLFSIKKFSEKHSNIELSENSIRWKIFNADSNGLASSGAIVRLGRRILIHEQKFFAWVLSNQPHAQSRRAA